MSAGVPDTDSATLISVSFRRTAWHPSFALFLQQRKPVGVALQVEVMLSQEPQRADILLLESTAERDDSTAQVFLPLWPLIKRRALLEFKSRKAAFEAGDFSRLVGYAGQYLAAHTAELIPSELTLVVVVAAVNSALEAELRDYGITLSELGRGYWVGRLGPFTVVLIDLSVVSESEHDEVMGLFARAATPGDAGWRWAIQNVFGETEAAMADLEGYSEILQEFLSKLAPEQRLAGLAPEQRLAGLSDEELERVLAARRAQRTQRE